MITQSPPEGAIFESGFNMHGARELARSVRAFLEGHGLCEQAVSEWELVTTEAAKSAVEKRSASQQPGNDTLRVMVNLWPESVEVCVDDHASDFALTNQPLFQNDSSESGLGLFIISKLTDSARYLSGAFGNTIVMRRARLPERSLLNVQCGDHLENTLDMMTEDLGTAYESLCTIFRFSKEFGETDDVQSFITHWLHELLRITGTTWFVMRRHQPADNTLQLLACSLAEKDIPAKMLSLSLEEHAIDSVETHAARTRREVWFDNCSSTGMLEPLTEFFEHPVSGISCPVHVSGRLFGVLTLGCASESCSLSTRDTRVVRMFADYIALQFSHQQAQQEVMRSRVIHRDLTIAAEIMRSLLPRQLPKISGYTCAAFLRPAQSVGGDLYDFLPLNDRGTLFVIADVMGKGPSAALIAIMFRSQLHTLARFAATPGKLLEQLNALLFQDLDHSDMFVSAQLVWFENATGNITIASAGHCPALIIDRYGRQLIEARGEGLPLGIDEHATFAEVKVDAHQACHILMLTDGVTDARNPRGEMLGKDNVVSCLMQFTTHGGNATRLQESVLTVIERHVQNAPAADDITLLVLSRDPTTEELNPNHSTP
jgi:serine phosphatase RsbU (regulator of sigma subunit)/anti-sigma regulatory factor (Ser/Thr protein kinase)